MSESTSENIEEVSAEENTLDASSEIRYLDPEIESVVDDSAEPLEPVVQETQVEPVSNQARVSLSFPWWVMIIVGTALGVGLHWLLRWLGGGWFWSERLVYFLSLGTLFLVVIGVSWLLARQGAHAMRLYIINLCIGLLTGVIISILLFLQHVAFWTFFNLLVQPVDALILAAIGSWLGTLLFINKK